MSFETQVLLVGFLLSSIFGASIVVGMGVAVKSNRTLFAAWVFLVSALMLLTSVFIVGSWIWAIAFSIPMFAAIVFMIVKNSV